MTLGIDKAVTEPNTSQNQIVIKSNNPCILRERSDRLAASEASLAVACERSEASVTASTCIKETGNKINLDIR